MYLWGSAGLTVNVSFDKPLILHIRNELFGELITLGTETANGVKTNLGALQPGECVSLPVQAVSGVFATCSLESTVECFIRAAQ
jgi:hypothetical protein